jgi:hypothetical protein
MARHNPEALLTSEQLSKSKGLYVIMDQKRSTIMAAPGQNKPFVTHSKKRAEEVAVPAKGVVETLYDAMKLVQNHPLNQEGLLG